jgi:transcriptional regulator with XRE-family HTH domain
MSAADLTETLRQARRHRRLSQLELSLRLGISQRHLSFVESGRSKPSRGLLLTWLEELGTPLALRNAALLQAGFAPAFSSASLSDSWLAPAQEALLQLLQAHEPMPAYVLDADWNVVHLNGGARWLFQTLVPWAAELPESESINMLELLAHPQGSTLMMTNLAEVGPALMAQLRDEAAVMPRLAPKVEAFAALLHERLGPRHSQAPTSLLPAPMVNARFATPQGELAFFTLFTTFGSPRDITLSSLRLEHMFPADARTRDVLENFAATTRET